MIKSIPILAKATVSSIKQPKELTTYNRDIDGKYIYGAEVDNYYYFPDSFIDRNYDLKAGISNFKKIPEEENLGDFKSILNALIEHEKQTGVKVESDIISFRGIMTKLLTLPILKEPMSLKIITYDGTIMMKNNDEFELNKQSSNGSPPNEYQKQCEYSGYKFEKLVMLPKPWSHCTRSEIENRHKELVNNYEQLLSVVRTSIGKTKLILAGEIDGIFDYKETNKRSGNLSHYIELKTNRVLSNENQMKTFEAKLYRTWAQCFLIGIKKVGMGFRDNDMLLRNIELYETDEIPLLLKDKINCLSSLRFFGAFIDWINDIDKSQNKSYTMVLENEKVVLRESEESFESEFLSEEFVKWRTEGV